MRRVEFYRHALTEEDIAAASEVLRSVFLTTGPRTGAFERAFAEYLGVDHVVGLTSCTSALFLALTALDLGPGDEVITTPMTFIATANAVIHTGARPVLVDVEPETGNISAAQIERALTPRTRAIIPVHLYGLMADMTAIKTIADAAGVAVIEDAAHATEAIRDGFRPGQRGRASCFSFYATKNLTCGEGGALATNDAALAERVKRLRSHGMSKAAAERYTGTYQHWDMTEMGYKANMSDIQAALLLGQIPRLESQLQRREAIARKYEEAFSKLEGVDFPIVSPGARSARHLFTIWAPEGARDAWLSGLQERGIGVAVNYRAIHLLTYYRNQFGFEPGTFPVAESIGNRTLTLPLYPGMSDEDVETVIAAVYDVAKAWRETPVQVS